MIGHCKTSRQLFVIVSVGIICSVVIKSTLTAVIDNVQNNDFLEAAEQIERHRDTSVNPCDNFKQYVCGNAKVLSFHERMKLAECPVNKRARDLIERGTGSVDFKPFKLIDDLYKTCMSDEATGQQAFDLLTQILYDLGNWPLLQGGKWMTYNFDWADFIIKSKRIGLSINTFLDFEPSLYPIHDKLLMKYRIKIPPQEFEKNISSFSDPLIIAYKNYITKVYALLGFKKEFAKEIDEIVEFEWQISEINMRRYKNIFSDDITFEELIHKFPSIKWQYLIDNVILRNRKTPVKISDIPFLEPPTLPDFIILLEKTPKHVQANYAVWKIIQNTIPYLTEEYRNLRHEYCLTRNCKNTARTHSCIGVIKKYLSPALNLLYAKNYYNSDIDMAIKDMIVNIKNQTIELINSSTWMVQDTKKKGIEMIKNIPIFIGYAEKYKSDDEFVKYYENLEIDTNNYFHTLLNLELFDSENKYDNITSLGAKNLFSQVEDGGPTNYYNRIDIPLAALEKPRFDINYPMYINYGRIGYYIANELVVYIRYLGANQNAYDEKFSCFQHQFRNFSFEGFKERSIWRTISYESSQISEQLAYKVSYQAYQHWLTKNGIEPSLPGLPYTNNQLFWINTLQHFCVLLPKESKVFDNKYGLFEYFFMNAISTVPEFFKDFNCMSDESFVKFNGQPCIFL
ncbi:neprilysin-2-like isoform X2 [Microplitis mediator]|uniref:neprilysin-2-like isoform X2 n=1 Tax=Microplitis mediator TaxID=375433 RepID=UPI002554E661|nr:neprilysin-2-like isoform X2 [Microplitis mediator]